MRKKEVLSAIGSVIYNYENNINKHTLESCPLCNLYFGNGIRCKKCPNFPFEGLYNNNPNNINSSGVPCFIRGLEYRKLDYGYEWNNEYHVQYWTLVYNMMKNESSKDVVMLSKKVQEKILAIAETFNDR